jgi:hypothetical protein
MESLFLLAFGEEEFSIAFAMACSEAFFNKLLIRSYFGFLYEWPLSSSRKSAVDKGSVLMH